MPIAADGTAAEGSAPWAGRSGSRRWQQRLRGRLRNAWNGFIGAEPEDQMLPVQARSAESPALLILAFIAAMAVLAVISAVRDGGQALGMLMGLIGAVAGLEMVCQAVERSRGRVLSLLLVKVAFFAAAIGAGVWVCLTVDHPDAYTRHPIVFLIYLLLITTAGLRDEPRLPLGAGIFALISYFAIAWLVPGIAAESEPAKAAALLRDFDGTALIGHGVILFCTTLMAVASARRGQAVRRLSMRDGLTGLVNRRVFDACLASEGERARRSGQPLSIAMIDVDFFKSLNDTYGHAFGDEVLRWIARLLRDSVRTTDLVARYGGEEFVVVFIDSDDDRLLERLDAMRARIAQTELHAPVAREAVHVSVSVGVASWPSEGEQLHDVVGLADQRLYLAKGAGRNRVVAQSLEAAAEA